MPQNYFWGTFLKVTRFCYKNSKLKPMNVLKKKLGKFNSNIYIQETNTFSGTKQKKSTHFWNSFAKLITQLFFIHRSFFTNSNSKLFFKRRNVSYINSQLFFLVRQLKMRTAPKGMLTLANKLTPNLFLRWIGFNMNHPKKMYGPWILTKLQHF